MSKKSNAIDVGWLSQQIGRPTLYNIVYQISRLIERKEITAGALLPTIRVLAKALAISPTTVATAYSELRARNIVQSKRGVGTVVIDNPVTEFPRRFSIVPISSKTHSQLNLKAARPDGSLLPLLAPALIYAEKNTVPNAVNNIEYLPIIPELQSALSANWPYRAEHFMAVNNSFEIISHLITLFVPANGYIAIENPTSVNEIDKLRRENIRVIAVECDREGPIIASLAKALTKKPALFIYQPREHLATTRTVSKARMVKMAELIKSHKAKMLIIENDIIGDISTFPSHSIGQFLPEQTVYIRAYLRVYSPDLCFMAASGPESIIQQLYHYRLYNLGWNSQILQYALAWLLWDKNSQRQVKQAQKVYRQRYTELLEALKARHIHLPNDNRPHLFLWLPVRSEKQALGRLAEKGIIACGGSHFMVTPPATGKEYIRIMTSQLSTPELINQVADAITYALTSSNTKSKIDESH